MPVETEELQPLSGDGADVASSLDRLVEGIRARLQSTDAASLRYVAEATRLVSRLHGPAVFRQQFDTLKDAVPHLYLAGAHREALAAAHAMRRAALASGTRAEICLAESHVGVVAIGVGNVASAIEHFQASLAIAREVGHAARAVSALLNLGSACAYGGLFRRAIAYAIEAERLEASSENRPFWLMMARGNQSFPLHQLGDLPAACEAMNRALEVVPRTPDLGMAYVLTMMELNFVQLTIDAGNLAMARARAGACARYAALAGTAPARTNALLAEALVDVYGGQIEPGLAKLHKAYEDSIPLQHIHRADALTAMIRAFERCDRPDDALRAMRELFELQMRIRTEALSLLSSLSLDHDLAERASESPDLHAWKHREARLEAAYAASAREERLLEMLHRMAAAATLRDDPTGLHGHRVGRLAALLAAEIGWPADRCLMLEKAARLHDIGKVGVPDRVLGSEALRRSEQQLMQSHTAVGASLLESGAGPTLTMAGEIAQWHHECWDGRGYPHGLSGEAIPVHARLVAVADLFDSLTHGRPYAPAVTRGEAVERIRAASGSRLEPVLANRFIELLQRLVRDEPDLDAFLSQGAEASLLRPHD